jgi:hypothetical protein
LQIEKGEGGQERHAALFPAETRRKIMRARIVVPALPLAAILMGTAAFLKASAGHVSKDGSDKLVIDIPEGEHALIEHVDLAGCRDQVVAGQETQLYASSSRAERHELASEPELVAKYCNCKFEAAETFMTKRQMVTNWLSASAASSKPLPSAIRKRFEQVIEDCAQAYGLRT